MGEKPSRLVVLAVLGLLAVAVGGAAGWVRRVPPSVTTATDPGVGADTIVDTSDIEVHVAGWVTAPGVVSLPADAIVADAVAAAGGLVPGAATEALNLAASLTDGEQIIVPGPGAVSAMGEPVGDGVVSLNTATAPELETLPGVGPVLAQRIVTYREDHGLFETVEDLLEVSGIGEAKLSSIRDLVRP